MIELVFTIVSRVSSLKYIEYIFGFASLKDIRRIYIQYRFGEYPSNLLSQYIFNIDSANILQTCEPNIYSIYIRLASLKDIQYIFGQYTLGISAEELHYRICRISFKLASRIYIQYIFGKIHIGHKCRSRRAVLPNLPNIFQTCKPNIYSIYIRLASLKDIQYIFGQYTLGISAEEPH